MTDIPVVPVWTVINGEEVTGWAWVSFANEDEFLGAVITEQARVPMLGIFGLNPGGEMMIIDLPPDYIPPDEFRNRLLTREEALSVPDPGLA
jgi:hypothetical protein